jgi:DNA polymerase I-like protein with 3'-5' exonuclease and polymerase domains
MDFLESLTEATRPDVAKRPWMEGREMHLVTEDMLDSVIDACIAAGRYALDIETTGLDNRVFNGRTRDQIVGFCLSPDGKRGYYLPIRHRQGVEHNLPLSRTIDAMRRLVETPGTVAIFHSSKFDCEFLQFADIGTWDDPRTFEDTLLLAWLKNTRQKTKGLKFEAQFELGRDMIKLNELFPADHKGPIDFADLDPSWEPCVLYACSDAICTYDLFDVLHPQVVAPDGDKRKGQGGIYEIEKLVVPATRWMERNRVYIDQAKVAELMQLGQQELFDCLNDIYDFCVTTLGRDIRPTWFKLLKERFTPNDPAYDIDKQIEDCRSAAKRTDPDEFDSKGHYRKIEKTVKLIVEGQEETFEGFPERYDILSRPQLGDLFCELEIPTLTRTGKSEQIKTTQDEIERLDEHYGTQFPFLPKIKRLGELQKALGTYLVSLHRDVAEDGTLRIDYNQCGTDTGRYTTPTSSDPAVDGGTKYPMHGTPATYDKKRPACLLRVRETIKARPRKVMVACDFGGVELRIATILSGEPKWLNEYFRCSHCKLEFDRGNGVDTPHAPPGYCPRCGSDRIGDLHTLTGVTFYGEEAPNGKQWKQQRNNAKSANFAMAYGGGPSAIMRSTGCDNMEAARHHRAFNESYATLRVWWDRIKSFGRQHGYVPTEFGRRYPIPDILLPTGASEVRTALLKDENRAKFTYRIYEQLHRNFKIKAKKIQFEKFGYEADKRPEELAARAVLQEYRTDIRTGDKKALDEAELKKRLIAGVQKAEDAVIKEQCERNRAFKAKAERNATNGPIQGLSADITKIAMALIYRECKKRGWLNKALLIITIHDELVFEIDEDILVEAVEVFQHLMTRNKTLLAKRWKVPLTTDCEIGFDWTVPWNLKDFKLLRVRADGLEVGDDGLLPRDKDGKLKTKLWPPLFVKLLGAAYGFAAVKDNPTLEEGTKLCGPDWQPLPLSSTPVPPTAPPPQLEASGASNEAPVAASVAASPEAAPGPEAAPEDATTLASQEGSGAQAETAPTPTAPAPTPVLAPVTSPFLKEDPLEYQLRELTIQNAGHLAQVIVQCMGRGTNPLKILGPNGESLLWDGADIKVNPVEFEYAMRFATDKGRH